MTEIEWVNDIEKPDDTQQSLNLFNEWRANGFSMDSIDKDVIDVIIEWPDNNILHNYGVIEDNIVMTTPTNKYKNIRFVIYIIFLWILGFVIYNILLV